MEILFHSHLAFNKAIATKFCTWHDSCAVVACAKVCCDLMANNRIEARRSFSRNWIAGNKPLVKRAAAPERRCIQSIAHFLHHNIHASACLISRLRQSKWCSISVTIKLLWLRTSVQGKLCLISGAFLSITKYYVQYKYFEFEFI